MNLLIPGLNVSETSSVRKQNAFCITRVQYKASHGLWQYWIIIVYEDRPEIILAECRTRSNRELCTDWRRNETFAKTKDEIFIMKPAAIYVSKLLKLLEAWHCSSALRQFLEKMRSRASAISERLLFNT